MTAADLIAELQDPDFGYPTAEQNATAEATATAVGGARVPTQMERDLLVWGLRQRAADALETLIGLVDEVLAEPGLVTFDWLDRAAELLDAIAPREALSDE